MSMQRAFVVAIFAVAALLCFAPARAEDLQTYQITIKDHHFAPAELHVPAGKPFLLEISNQEAQADEFETASPPLEKVVQPGATGKVRVRPLSKGRFPYYDDFHPDNKGVIVAD
jgi:Cupredoxin-like domain